jgi:hypothetical protein
VGTENGDEIHVLLLSVEFFLPELSCGLDAVIMLRTCRRWVDGQAEG